MTKKITISDVSFENNKFFKFCVVENLSINLILQIPILQSPHVHMKNESDVIQKINKIIHEGSNKLQVCNLRIRNLSSN